MSEEITSERTVSLKTVGKLLKEAGDVYKEKIKIFLAVLAVPVVIVQILTYLVLNVILSYSINPDSFYQQNKLLAIILIIISTLVAIMLTFLSQAALIHVLKNRKETYSVEEIYKTSRTVFLLFVWVAILSGVIIGGGFWFLIIPGIIFIIWFEFATYILIAEKETGMNALIKSKEYVRGYWWQVFGRLMPIFLVSVVISVLFSSLIKAVQMPFLKEILDLVISLLFMPFFVSYTYLLYENLKSVHPVNTYENTKDNKIFFLLVGIVGFFLIQPFVFLYVIPNLLA